MKIKKIFYLTLLFLFSIIFGYWISRGGKAIIVLPIFIFLIFLIPFLSKKYKFSWKNKILIIIFLILGLLIEKIGFITLSTSFLGILSFSILLFGISGAFLIGMIEYKTALNKEFGYVFGSMLILIGLFGSYGVSKDIINNIPYSDSQIAVIIFIIMSILFGISFLYLAYKTGKKLKEK